MTNLPPVDQAALTAAHKAVEDVLVDLRDNGISTLECANGIVIRSRDGEPSPVIRIGTREALEIGIKAYLAATIATL
jgi:hypothetical protein